jgi:FkbM family methyltransferase
MRPLVSRLNHSPLWHQEIRLWDSVFTAPTLDRLAALCAHRFGWMGSAEKSFLGSIVRDDSIIADVGANQGVYSLWLAGLASKGRVYAFEPDPELFRCLEGNTTKNQLSNLLPIQAAASNQPGTLSFAVNRLNRGDNRVTAQAGEDADIMEVRAVRLDDAISDLRLDVLKIDVQGFEIEVLLGAQEILRANPNLTILFEFWPYGLRQAGHSTTELWNLLKEAGFSIAALDRDGKLATVTQELFSWKRKTQYCNLIAHH